MVHTRGQFLWTDARAFKAARVVAAYRGNREGLVSVSADQDASGESRSQESTGEMWSRKAGNAVLTQYH